MTRTSKSTAPREIGAIVEQTAELRRLCVSLRYAKNQEREAALAAEFERAALEPDGLITAKADVIRAGFRSLWRQGIYDRIVALAGCLPQDLLQGDETVLMYYLCALRCRAETPLVAGVDLPTSGEVWVDDSESWNGRTVEPPNGRTLSGGSA